MVAFAEILKFDPGQIQEIFSACSGQQQACSTLDGHLTHLSDLRTWEGDASEAAKNAAGKTRKNLDAHGNEVWKVAAAARDCYNEAVELRTSATRAQADADARGLVIDPTSGQVTDPNPPIMRGWHQSDKAAYFDEIRAMQARVNDVIAAADRFDDDLAAAINAADGSIPLTPKGEGANVNLADRRANQVAAYRKTYGTDPATANDWRMAAVLDPHNYGAKTAGTNANLVVERIRPVPGQGLVRTSQFIKQRDVSNPTLSNPAGRNKGDDRGYDPDFDPTNARVAAYIDYDKGVVVFRQNPSVVQQADGSSGHAEAGKPWVRVNQAGDGSVLLQYNAADPIGMGGPARFAGFSANGNLAFTPTGHGTHIDGTRTDFPWFEAYQSFPDGREAVLTQDDSRGFGTGSSLGAVLNILDHHEVGAGVNALRDPKWTPAPLQLSDVPPVNMVPAPGHGPQ